MHRNPLEMTVDVSEQDIEAADQLLENLLGANHNVVITRDVLHAFEDRYSKSYFAVLAEALAGGTLSPGTVLTFDVHALTDDRLDELKAAIEANPDTSYRLKLKVVYPDPSKNEDDDLYSLDKIARFKTSLRVFEISNLMRQQNTNRIRMNWYQMQCGFFGNTAVPQDVLGLILNHVREGDQHPHPRPARAVMDNLSRIRNDELQKRMGNSSK